jgi:hypothetical protein
MWSVATQPKSNNCKIIYKQISSTFLLPDMKYQKKKKKLRCKISILINISEKKWKKMQLREGKKLKSLER